MIGSVVGDLDGQCFLGFDPGGAQAFGVAVLTGRTAGTTTVDTVHDAMSWAVEALRAQGVQPKWAGIDTLLHWSTGQGGWRRADVYLRDRYSDVRNSIASPNSLYGAMAIGGMALAFRLRERWPDLVLNETHPKVLLYEFRRKLYGKTNFSQARDWLAAYTHLDLSKVKDEHQLDAVVSAWATRKAQESDWLDLATSDASTVHPVGNVTYRWPPSSA